VAACGTLRPVTDFPVVREVDPVVEAYKAGIDVTLLDRNLRLTVEQRLVQLMELQRFADELVRAGRSARPVA
jgi:hypothetical protein